MIGRRFSVTLLLGIAGAFSGCGGAPEVNAPSNVPPTAAFTVHCDRLGCTFNNSSTDIDGKIAAYHWDFGDNGAHMTTRDAAHRYAAPGGRFVVTLSVTDDAGQSASATEVIVVSEGNAAPTADFTVSCDALTCNFTNRSSDPDAGGSVAAFSWSFGDSQMSTEEHPEHTYAAAGTYMVGLSIIDDLGKTASVSKEVTAVGPSWLTAAFTVSCVELECTFTDESTPAGVIGFWFWDFGDGETSTDQNPTHVYRATQPTRFTVSLGIHDSFFDTSDGISQDITVPAE